LRAPLPKGAHNILAARRADRLEALAMSSGQAQSHTGPTDDVTDEQDVIALLPMRDHQLRSDGRSDVKQWRDMLDVNLTAAFLCGREALRVMQTRLRAHYQCRQLIGPGAA